MSAAELGTYIRSGEIPEERWAAVVRALGVTPATARRYERDGIPVRTLQRARVALREAEGAARRKRAQAARKGWHTRRLNRRILALVIRRDTAKEMNRLHGILSAEDWRILRDAMDIGDKRYLNFREEMQRKGFTEREIRNVWVSPERIVA